LAINELLLLGLGLLGASALSKGFGTSDLPDDATVESYGTGRYSGERFMNLINRAFGQTPPFAGSTADKGLVDASTDEDIGIAPVGSLAAPPVAATQPVSQETGGNIVGQPLAPVVGRITRDAEYGQYVVKFEGPVDHTTPIEIVEYPTGIESFYVPAGGKRSGLDVLGASIAGFGNVGDYLKYGTLEKYYAAQI